MGPVTEQEAYGLASKLVSGLTVALRQLEQAGRYLHPTQVGRSRERLDESAPLVKAALDTLLMSDWPESWQKAGESLLEGTGHLQTTISDFIAASRQPAGIWQQMQALHGLPLAEEAFYPLCALFPDMSQAFLEPGVSIEMEVLRSPDKSQDEAGPSLRVVGPDTGLQHAENQRSQRGGCALYVPEYYSSGHDWPLIVALHGGSGHGRDYLWTWLRVARTRGALLLCPTSLGSTWSLLGQDVDHAIILHAVQEVINTYRVSKDQILLTGMSDGATYTFLSGLAPAAPYTHLAPMSGVLHPFILTGDNSQRIKDKPVYLLHGALDTLFPVETAREARDLLLDAGANLTYREVPDLGHTNARDEQGALLDWFGLTLK